MQFISKELDAAIIEAYHISESILCHESMDFETRFEENPVEAANLRMFMRAFICIAVGEKDRLSPQDIMIGLTNRIMEDIDEQVDQAYMDILLSITSWLQSQKHQYRSYDLVRMLYLSVENMKKESNENLDNLIDLCRGAARAFSIFAAEHAKKKNTVVH